VNEWVKGLVVFLTGANYGRIRGGVGGGARGGVGGAIGRYVWLAIWVTKKPYNRRCIRISRRLDWKNLGFFKLEFFEKMGMGFVCNA
jgi:hypothetical protein